MSKLAEPTAEAIEAIRRNSPVGVCELGAGDGQWLEAMQRAGIPCVGYDRHPRGPLVALGDEFSASRHTDLSLLIVWPPDGSVAAGWIRVWLGSVVMICASWGRLIVETSLDGFRLVEEVTVPPGHKGGSELRVYAR